MIEESPVVYNDGEIELKVSVNEETIWLTQKQLSILFEVETHTINYHIKNIFTQNELSRSSTIRKIRIVQKEGKRKIARDVEHYDLDMIISVGYRVNSLKATKFRQWATKVLKEYIVDGFVINREKITQQRLVDLESDVRYIKSHIKDNTITIKQGIFFNGEMFDAYVFINDLLKSAKQEIILIDNYIDDTVLTLFSKYSKINFVIIAKSISKQTKLDIEKYCSQYNNLEVKLSNNFHDRFLIIDNNDTYHIGASLKDLGKKVFAFSTIDIMLLEDKIRKEIHD